MHMHVMVMIHRLRLSRQSHRPVRHVLRRGQLQVGEHSPPRRPHPQIVPVYPCEPRRQIGSVPLGRSFRSDLAAQTAFDVHEGLHGVRVLQDLAKERDVGDGQAEGVDLGEALLVREGRNVQSELLEGRVDAGGAGKEFNGSRDIFGYLKFVVSAYACY